MSSPREDTTLAGVPGLGVALRGSWVIDVEGRTRAINTDAAALLGYAPGELMGRPVGEFVYEEDRPTLAAALERRRRGIQETYEVRWRRGDGSAVWTLMAATPMYDDEGRFAGSFALVTDVTERRRAEELVREHARRQAAAAELGRLALGGEQLDRLFDAAVRTVAEVLAADLSSVHELRSDGRLGLAAIHGLPAGMARDVAELQVERSPVDRRTDAGALVVEDWEARDASSLPASVRALGVRSSASVAITGRRPHGVLGVARRTPWRPDDDALGFLQAVANTLAAAIERAAGDDEVRHRALHDQLTGLPNRTLALDRIEQALVRARRQPHTVGVIVVDLDRFKAVNDAFGVEAGDEVLATIAAAVRRTVRPDDTVARLSGDAFVVLCDDLTEDAVIGAVADRVLDAVRTPLVVDGEPVVLSASVGVAVAHDHERAGDLLRDADVAVGRAKAAGRDRFELFDESLRAEATGRVRIERDLRGAVARQELFMVHQPIVGLSSGRIAGVESLVRWRHPERGVVAPGEFIGVAEETGMIGEIGAWVLRAACSDIVRRQGARPLTCHVNLSPRQAADAGLPSLVREALAGSGLSPEQLVLEITESSLMKAGDAPLEVLSAVRALGVRLVLDDFGTGYSSLARLRAFPIDGLKVDRSFVAALDAEGGTDALIVAGIIDLARALGLTVVAEGVETNEQLTRLRSAGCSYAQGFLLARPAEAQFLDELLARPGLLPASVA